VDQGQNRISSQGMRKGRGLFSGLVFI